MGKVYQNKECSKCDFKGEVIEVFGKYYCRTCYDKKPKRGGGHSGMIPLPYLKLPIQDSIPFKPGLVLERTTKGNKIFATLYCNHYPGSKGIMGRQINYFIKENGKLLGIIGGNSPPLNYKKFSRYFGDGFTELNWMNNNVFCLIEHPVNLGTRVLRLFRYQCSKDYAEKYGDKLVGFITFVEPPRTGVVYKADNWDYLGMTEGKKCVRRGDLGKWTNKEWGVGTKKLIFAVKLKSWKSHG